MSAPRDTFADGLRYAANLRRKEAERLRIVADGWLQPYLARAQREDEEAAKLESIAHEQEGCA